MADPPILQFDQHVLAPQGQESQCVGGEVDGPEPDDGTWRPVIVGIIKRIGRDSGLQFVLVKVQKSIVSAVHAAGDFFGVHVVFLLAGRFASLRETLRSTIRGRSASSLSTGAGYGNQLLPGGSFISRA